MAGAGGNKKARIKVKRFKPEWLDQTIEGSKASLWLNPDVSDSGRALCTVCPAPCYFKINEGWAAVKQHGKYKKHMDNLKMSQTNPEFEQVDNSPFPRWATSSSQSSSGQGGARRPGVSRGRSARPRRGGRSRESD